MEVVLSGQLYSRGRKNEITGLVAVGRVVLQWSEEETSDFGRDFCSKRVFKH